MFMVAAMLSRMAVFRNDLETKEWRGEGVPDPRRSRPRTTRRRKKREVIRHL